MCAVREHTSMGVDARARVGNRECECESESVDRASESVTKKGT